MGVVANLAVRLGINNEDLDKGLAAANRSVQSFGKNLGGAGADIEGAFGGVIDTAKHIGAALGVAFSVDAFVGAEEQVLGFASTINDLSLQTGIGVEGLQALNYAAVGSGVSIDQLANGISMMSKRIALGDNSAVDAFARLGLSLTDVRNMAPDQVFYQIADAVLKIPNPMEQAAIMTELFGRSGAQYLPLIKDNLQEIREEAERNGSVISTELIQKADQLDDAWNRAKIRGKALLSEVLIPMTDIMFSGAASRYSLAGMIGVGEVDNLAELKKKAAGPDLSGMMPAGLQAPASMTELARAQKEIDDQLKQQRDERERKQKEFQSFVDNISGANLVAKAQEWEKAVAAIGGAEHLTSEKTKEYTNALIAAAEAMQAAGQAAPAYWSMLMRGAQESKAAAITTAALGKELEQAVGRGSPQLLIPTITNPQAMDLLNNPANMPGVGAQKPREGYGAGAQAAEILYSHTLRGQLQQGLTSSVNSLPQTILGAIQGGGSVLGSISSQLGGTFAKQFSGSVSKGLQSFLPKGLSDSIGSLMGPLGAMLGPMVGQLIGKVATPIWHGIQSIFGRDEEARVVNPARDTFMSQFQVGQFATLNRNDALIKTLEAAGLGGAPAAALMQALNTADTMEKFNAAKGRIEASLAGAKQGTGTEAAAADHPDVINITFSGNVVDPDQVAGYVLDALEKGGVVANKFRMLNHQLMEGTATA